MQAFKPKKPQGSSETILPRATEEVSHLTVNKSWPHLIAGAYVIYGTSLKGLRYKLTNSYPPDVVERQLHFSHLL